jgi:hypothetical protein
MAFAMDPPWGTEWIGASASERADALVDLLGFVDALPQGRREDGSPSLAEKILAVHRALADVGIEHAVGGAIAFAYYGEPRMTIDIDLNIFTPTDRWPEVALALAPLGIDVAVDEQALARDKEVKVPWDRNPVHLFFSFDELHAAMPAAIRRVPFAGSTIPIVSPEHLVIRKVTLDRSKDWPDVEAILVAQTPLDLAEIKAWLQRLIGPADPRQAKLDIMVNDASSRS